MARAVCEGAPSCISLILPLFCRWGMQTGVRIAYRYSGYPLPPHIVFLSFFASFKITPRMIKMLYLHILGHPKPKKMLIFRFVGIFEYIILLMVILFLDMCQNS